MPAPAPSAASAGAAWRQLLLLLTVLPLTLAALAFVLQWRGGGVDDPTARWPSHAFPGAEPTLRSLPFSSCADVLVGSSVPSFPYFRGWSFPYDSGEGLQPKICVQTSTSAGLEQILPWLFYHKVIGVSQFLLFVEGRAAKPHVAGVLESIPGVKVVYRTKELEEQQAHSRIWNETWLAGFFYKPCNYELFVKQSLNMEMAIVMARDAGMDWIIHLDTDELLYPGGAAEYSVRRLLGEVPRDVDMVIFPNYESSVECDNIKDPFSEVSLFRAKLCGQSGHSGVSLLRLLTACHITNSEIKLEEAAVLHYTYTKFSDLTSRRDRCGCKPTKEDVKRCFMLDFDRAAIVQGLRESGVFTSVIEAGQSVVSDKLSAKKTIVQSQNVTRPGDLPRKLIGANSAASTRKILQTAERTIWDTNVTAVPPLSPPSLDDHHKHT
ncbi:hypothetical protein PR202_ga07998 [Eleusine coracana subsp. coracana]|uniref:Glycosyltransferase family 92 protein n=1 Tax=Eleusine coracana subsp. coracana TaxID=191504 RepID=A0AAV5BYX9_ELECO|nr:hypothetical protein PR202_ga07998 [Eleusine coracana subsp. coracana]